MTDHAPGIAHSFETCADAGCDEVLCRHYRAGLVAGHDFMARGSAGDRDTGEVTGSGEPVPERDEAITTLTSSG